MIVAKRLAAHTMVATPELQCKHNNKELLQRQHLSGNMHGNCRRTAMPESRDENDDEPSKRQGLYIAGRPKLSKTEFIDFEPIDL